MKLQVNVIRAVFWRNFISYFSNPIGYLFITAFVWGCAYFAFWHNDAFFANNLADLDQLNLYFPYLLLFFIPAITMSVWAEERKTGTEELLLTLPASDLEIVLGKFLSCLAIYTVSLLFSVSNVVVLRFLGNPDLGLMFSTYLGYWLIGAALLSAGMVASMLTANVTVAFILGAGLCLILVSIHLLGMVFSPESFGRELFGKLGVVPNFEPFGKGMVTLAGIFYFVSIVAVMLYLNMVLLSRRHWGGSQEAPERWLHSLARASSLVLAAVCATILASRAQAYLMVDTTQERIFSLSPRTKEILEQVDSSRPVLVEAFISPTVPRELVETRKNLIDLLTQFDAMGGNRVEVKIHDTPLFSTAARDAERVYDIKPETVPTFVDGRFSQEKVFLGVAFKCGLNTKTIPFFYRGLPVEFELARMIRTVSQKEKRKIGVLTTDAALFGSFNFQMMQPSRDWQIIDELKQQYDVVQVSPDSAIAEKIDVLIVPMVSSLSQPQMDNVLAYIKSGKATLILDDPMPVVNPRLAAKEQRQRNQNPFMGGGQPPPVPKGNVRAITDALNIEFDAANVIWQLWNPHPQYRKLPPEYVFIGAGSGNPDAFNRESVITSGLQEVIMMYPGAIRSKGGNGPSFLPLLETGGISGTTPWNDIFTDTMFGMRAMNEFPRRRKGSGNFVLAAMLRGKFADTTSPEMKDEKDKEDPAKKNAPPAADCNVIFIADLDMISDGFFELRKQGEENLTFDNVTFVANCVDMLAGDESFVELRKKRLKRRNLELIDKWTRDTADQTQKEEQRAEEEAQKQLEEAQAALQAKVDELSRRKDIDERTKRVQSDYLRQVEQQKLDARQADIEATKKDRKQQAELKLQANVHDLQRNIKLMAVLLPPIPAFLIGLAIFFARATGEKEGVNPNRLVKR